MNQRLGARGIHVNVEDLLTAAKAEMGRLKIARVPTNLRAQAAQVLESLDTQAIRHVELSGPNANCIGDPARVRQVVRNLLTNAHRYGGDPIWIQVSQGPSTGRVTVTDNGPGIPIEKVEQAFLPYHRSTPTEGLAAALGIGLPISRNLARLMHGDLTYEYVDGQARFELTLPLAEPESPQVAVHSSAASSGSKVRSMSQAANR